MKDKSKVAMWMCFTVLVAAGMKYVPPYLLDQQRLDMQQRVLDLREEAFLHQKTAPTVSVPEEGTAVNSRQLLVQPPADRVPSNPGRPPQRGDLPSSWAQRAARRR